MHTTDVHPVVPGRDRTFQGAICEQRGSCAKKGRWETELEVGKMAPTGILYLPHDAPVWPK